MNKKQKIKIIVLILVVVLLAIACLITYLVVKPDLEESKDPVVEDNTIYPVDETPEEILSVIYNEKADPRVYLTTDSYQSILGNKTEKLVSSLSEETKMNITLYTFDTSMLPTSSCSDYTWNNSWNTCGGAPEDGTYELPVPDFNNRYAEIFGEELDYSNLDTANLNIGSCAGEEGTFPFQYIAAESVYLSTINKENCTTNETLEITNVTKTQEVEDLTLDVYYTTSSNGNEVKKHDKLFFKVEPSGNYYLYSSVMIAENLE